LSLCALSVLCGEMKSAEIPDGREREDGILAGGLERSDRTK